jgi:hypothetical protein
VLSQSKIDPLLRSDWNKLNTFRQSDIVHDGLAHFRVNYLKILPANNHALGCSRVAISKVLFSHHHLQSLDAC